MNRPYIFCHMMTSLDGKIMGSYMNTKGEKTLEMYFITYPLEKILITNIKAGFPAE